MNVSLTKVSQKDLSKIILWRNSETVWRFSNQYILLNMKKQKQWFDQISKEDSKFVFMIHFNKKPVGVCSLINYQKELKCAEVSIMIGEKNLQGKCIGKQSLEKLLEFGFNKLNLHRIEANIFDFNCISKEFFMTMGFFHECVLREKLWRNGKWCDVELYSILRNEFKKRT